jgi:hypothetical protein
MYKDIATYRDKYKHNPHLQSGFTNTGDKIYRCLNCYGVAFVTPNNDVYGYGTETICSRPILSLRPYTMAGINVEVTEHQGSTRLYYLPNKADLTVLMAQLAATAFSYGHKMEPTEPHLATVHMALVEKRVEGMRCSQCYAPITGGFHHSRTVDGIQQEYVMVVAAWRLMELCRGYHLDKVGNKVYPRPEFPAYKEITLAATGEVVSLCDEHTSILDRSNEIYEQRTLEHPVECIYCIRRYLDSAIVYTG